MKLIYVLQNQYSDFFTVISPMQFSIPASTSLEQSIIIFNGVKKYMNSKGYKPYHVAISKIEFANKGNIRIAEVNQIIGINDEIVVLIFECENLFLICTASRGVAGGEPIIVSRKEMIQVIYFDNLPANK
jgi:hypothetical protein